jgi:hypothetical protein
MKTYTLKQSYHVLFKTQSLDKLFDYVRLIVGEENQNKVTELEISIADPEWDGSNREPEE